MRGDRREEDQLFSYVPLEDRVPQNHPLRAMRQFVDPILAELSPHFDAIYSKVGRPSIPPEQLLRALLLQVFYSVRSERMLCEQLEYNLLFRWFVGLGMDGQVWDPTVFTKNRDRLLEGEIANHFFDAVVAQARKRGWLSNDHFTVDGTLLKAWASQKSFQPKETEPRETQPREIQVKKGRRPGRRAKGRNPDRNFRGEARSNETHASRTDPDARLARKGKTKESHLAYLANVLMENRNGLIVDTEVMSATGTAEREAALRMVDRLPPRARRRTLGADKGYDTQDWVADLRARSITPHVAQNNSARRRSAIDKRTTRHAGYDVSQQKRKLVEQTFGWAKTVGLLDQLRHRGLKLVDWVFKFTTAAYNLVRMRTLSECES